MTNPNQRYLTKREIARYISVSIRTIDNWMADGTLPFLKVGRTVRFDRSLVDQALADFIHNEGGKR